MKPWNTVQKSQMQESILQETRRDFRRAQVQIKVKVESKSTSDIWNGIRI